MKTYADISGDGGSNIVQQIIAQRKQVTKRLGSARHLLAIGSGKGGVGKSTLSMQLALAFRSLGHSVALLDADFNGPSIARQSGLQSLQLVPGETGLVLPKTPDGIGVLSFGSVLPENSTLDFESVTQREAYTWRETKEFTTLAEVIAGTEWGELDVLLLDLPPGPERTFHFADFFGDRLNLVLVTAPSDVSRGVVSRSITAARRSDCRLLGYVENMKGYYSAKHGEVLPLFPETSTVELDIARLGEIPFDPELAAASDRGVSVEQCQGLYAFEALKGLAENLYELLEEKE